MVYARTSSGHHVLRLGADHPSENLTMLETGEAVYSPVTQVLHICLKMQLSMFDPQ